MENVFVIAAEKETFNSGFAFHVSKALAATIVKVALAGIVIFNIATQVEVHRQAQIIPVKIEQAPTVTTSVKMTPEALAKHRTRNALILLNCPPEKIEAYTLACVLGAQVPKVDPVLIACLMKTESDFKSRCTSSMGYKGVMQTPTATGYVEADTVHGCNKLRDHLAMAKGDLPLALTNYKGSKRQILSNGKKSVGYKQALEVLELYRNVKRSV